jgi:hypothetical protein
MSVEFSRLIGTAVSGDDDVEGVAFGLALFEGGAGMVAGRTTGPEGVGVDEDDADADADGAVTVGDLGGAAEAAGATGVDGTVTIAVFGMGAVITVVGAAGGLDEVGGPGGEDGFRVDAGGIAGGVTAAAGASAEAGVGAAAGIEVGAGSGGEDGFRVDAGGIAGGAAVVTAGVPEETGAAAGIEAGAGISGDDGFRVLDGAAGAAGVAGVAVVAAGAKGLGEAEIGGEDGFRVDAGGIAGGVVAATADVLDEAGVGTGAGAGVGGTGISSTTSGSTSSGSMPIFASISAISDIETNSSGSSNSGSGSFGVDFDAFARAVDDVVGLAGLTAGVPDVGGFVFDEVAGLAVVPEAEAEADEVAAVGVAVDSDFGDAAADVGAGGVADAVAGVDDVDGAVGVEGAFEIGVGIGAGVPGLLVDLGNEGGLLKIDGPEGEPDELNLGGGGGNVTDESVELGVTLFSELGVGGRAAMPGGGGNIGADGFGVSARVGFNGGGAA